MKLLALTLLVCVLGEFIVNIFIVIVTLVIALFSYCICNRDGKHCYRSCRNGLIEIRLKCTSHRSDAHLINENVSIVKAGLYNKNRKLDLKE